jgi:hypothetical protein
MKKKTVVVKQLEVTPLFIGCDDLGDREHEHSKTQIKIIQVLKTTNTEATLHHSVQISYVRYMFYLLEIIHNPSLFFILC